YTFSGLFQGLASGGINPSVGRPTSTDVLVLDPQGGSLFSTTINGFGDTTPFGFTTALKAGDPVRFVVTFGDDGSINSDSTGLKVLATTPVSAVAVPEPSSLSLLAAGGGLLLLLWKRKKGYRRSEEKIAADQALGQAFLP